MSKIQSPESAKIRCKDPRNLCTRPFYRKVYGFPSNKGYDNLRLTHQGALPSVRLRPRVLGIDSGAARCVAPPCEGMHFPPCALDAVACARPCDCDRVCGAHCHCPTAPRPRLAPAASVATRGLRRHILPLQGMRAPHDSSCRIAGRSGRPTDLARGYVLCDRCLRTSAS
jgi:hypothetical protein